MQVQHMHLLTRDELKTLIEHQEEWCVSLFLPTYRAGLETKQNPIRCKNLLREVEGQMRARGLRPPTVEEFLTPAEALLKNDLFWQYQSDGLAVFLSPEVFRSYRLPFHFDELVVMTDRFHLKPLLPLFFGDGRFYVLALSQNAVRFFQGTRYSVSAIDVEGLPKSMAEALRYDDPERQLQFHTEAQVYGRAGEGQRAAMFHGHGVGTDDAKVNLLRYFQRIDGGLQELLAGERVPLVLAGVDYLLPIYREANRYRYLMEEGITGNPEGLSAKELHEQAWSIVEPHFQQEQNDAVAKYRQLAGTGRTANDVKEIVPAAYNGRVEHLFVAVGLQQWGTFDPTHNEVQVHPEAKLGNEDLLDLAAIYTFLNSGTVFAVQPEKVPDAAPLAAVFRY